MSSTSSRLAEIVDQTAAIAAGIAGVSAVWGVGSGLVSDPLRPGLMIEPAQASPVGEMVHVSDLPDTGRIDYAAMTGVVEVTWVIPMRLFLPRNDLANFRRRSAPMYAAYISAFAAHQSLGGLARNLGQLTFATLSNDDWAWIEMKLTVVERLNLATGA